MFMGEASFVVAPPLMLSAYRTSKFPEDSFTIEGIKSSKISMLGFDGNVNTKGVNKGVIIYPPNISPATNPCDYAWVFKVADFQ